MGSLKMQGPQDCKIYFKACIYRWPFSIEILIMETDFKVILFTLATLVFSMLKIILSVLNNKIRGTHGLKPNHVNRPFWQILQITICTPH